MRQGRWRGRVVSTGYRQLLAVSLFGFSAGTSATDLGFFYGEPTPALAMYGAQVGFAADRCVAEGYVQDRKGAATLLKQFNNLIALRKYNKEAPDFVANLEAFSGRYRAAWNASAPDVRQRFCDGFNGELAAKKDGWLRWIAPIGYFRAKFSPISEKSAKRQQNIVGALSVVGTVATNAASISAGRDAIAMTKAGDYGASLQQMEVAHDFNQAGAAFAEVGSTATGKRVALMSVMEEKDDNGKVRVIPCPVTEHFFGYAASPDSETWTTYQRVSMQCREPVQADLQFLN